jgi:hypothetical protein
MRRRTKYRTIAVAIRIAGVALSGLCGGALAWHFGFTPLVLALALVLGVLFGFISGNISEVLWHADDEWKHWYDPYR